MPVPGDSIMAPAGSPPAEATEAGVTAGASAAQVDLLHKPRPDQARLAGLSLSVSAEPRHRVEPSHRAPGIRTTTRMRASAPRDAWLGAARMSVESACSTAAESGHVHRTSPVRSGSPARSPAATPRAWAISTAPRPKAAISSARVTNRATAPSIATATIATLSAPAPMPAP
jgi:hypothetical protein